MSTEKILWGSYDGKDCYLVTLKNKNMTASFTSYGGAIVNLLVPDKNGNVADVVLGYDDLDGYVNVKDATTIQKHLASIITLDDPALGVADYDGDTRITVRDATEIQKFIAGIK